jgi:prophage antirepressor-like protein
MYIVKAFNSNNLQTEVVIKGTKTDPLFRASDIGVVLEISNIRTSIMDFDESEKVVHSMNTLDGNQDVTFLTEKGLYKVLFRSRKPIAQRFQNWVCEVIKEIRLNGTLTHERDDAMCGPAALLPRQAVEAPPAQAWVTDVSYMNYKKN